MTVPRIYVRKLTVTGRDTYSVTLPKDMIQKLHWRQGQRVVFELSKDKITIRDCKEEDL